MSTVPVTESKSPEELCEPSNISGNETQDGGLEIKADPQPESISPRKIHGARWFLVVAGILTGPFLYALDNTIVANIIPPITTALGGVEKLPWLSVGYMLGGVVMILPASRLYGSFDAKLLYIIFTILFIVGSAVCGAAPNINALIVGRVITGIGGNGRYCGTTTLLSVNTSEKERPMYISLIGIVYGIGTIVGSIIGGAFAQSSASWRWGFYISVVIAGAFIPIYVLLLTPYDPRAGAKLLSRVTDFDILGSLLQAGVLASIMMAMNFGGTLYRWNSGQIIALFIVAGVCLIAFALQQYFAVFTTPRDRIFPAYLLTMKEPILLFLLMASAGAATFVVIFYVPVWLQFTRGFEPLASGVRLLPFLLPFIVAILVNGVITSKTGLYKPWYIFGSAVTLIGGVLISRVGANTSLAHMYGYEVMLGFSTGAYVQIGVAVIQAIVDRSQRAHAVSFIMLAQLLGFALSLSISGAIFVNKAVSGLQHAFPSTPTDEIQAIVSGTSGAFLRGLDPTSQVEAIAILATSVEKVFILVYVAGAVSVVCAIFLDWQSPMRLVKA